MRNCNTNLEGNKRRSGKSHIGLKTLHPRILPRAVQTRKELMSPVNFREAHIHTIWGRGPDKKEDPKIFPKGKEKVAYKGITVFFFNHS